MDVQWEGGEGERVGHGRDEFDKPGRRGEREGAMHGEGDGGQDGGGAKKICSCLEPVVIKAS